MTDNPYDSPANAGTTALTAGQTRSFLVRILVVIGIVAVLFALILPSIRTAPEASTRIRCLNNIQNITRALLSYAATHKAFPPAYTVDGRGNRLHSWRTLLLPHLDQRSLHQSIDFSKPWNDPANVKAFNTQLDVFSCPSAKLKPGFTTYLGNATSDGCFAGSRPRPLAEITDPHNQTVLIAEVASGHAVHWMAPEDADENILLNFLPRNQSAHPGVVNAAFVDGSVRSLSVDVDPQVSRTFLTVSGNDLINTSDF